MIDRDPRVIIAELAARIDKLENEVKQPRLPEVERLRAALRQILEDPDAKILDSHREDGWEALRKL